MKKTLYILPILYLIAIIICIIFSYNKGLTPDTINYFGMSENLPRVKINIFPIGYPFTIFLIKKIGLNTFLSSKLIGVLCLISIVFLSYWKNFYWKETILLLGLKIFSIFYFSWSEPLFLALFYFYIYIIHQFLCNKISNKKFFIITPLLLFLIFTVRYSGLFVLISLYFYIAIDFFKTKRINIRLFVTSLISSALILFYLVINKVYFGSFFGSRSNLAIKNNSSFIENFKNNIITFSHSINPFYTEIDYSVLAIRISIVISMLILIFIAYKISKIKIWIIVNNFNLFLFINAVIYFILIFLTNLNTKIDGLNFRLLLPSIFIFYFLIITNYLERNKNIYIIYLFIFLSLVINTASVISIQ